MAKCRCMESRSQNPRWRIIKQRPRGKGIQYRLICLSCEYEWWSTSRIASEFPTISRAEKDKLELPSS